MMLAVILSTLLAIPLLALVTFVQMLYLESMRLRTRDLPSLKFFKDTLEDRLGMKTDDGENHRHGAITGRFTSATDYDPIKYAPSQCNLHNMY